MRPENVHAYLTSYQVLLMLLVQGPLELVRNANLGALEIYDLQAFREILMHAKSLRTTVLG